MYIKRNQSSDESTTNFKKTNNRREKTEQGWQQQQSYQPKSLYKKVIHLKRTRKIDQRGYKEDN